MEVSVSKPVTRVGWRSSNRHAPLTKASRRGQLGPAAHRRGHLAQTLFFKFTGAEESVYIFRSVGQFLHLAGVEPWGRIASGIVELIAALLLIAPATSSIGAVLTMGVMAGAIASHLIILGIDVKGDGGLLFALALTAFLGSAIVLVLHRPQIPIVGRLFQLA
jgi:hypothetical protein